MKKDKELELIYENNFLRVGIAKDDAIRQAIHRAEREGLPMYIYRSFENRGRGSIVRVDDVTGKSSGNTDIYYYVRSEKEGPPNPNSFVLDYIVNPDGEVINKNSVMPIKKDDKN